MIFEEKYFSIYILLTDQISLFDCLCFLRYWAIISFPVCDVINFEKKHNFLMNQNVRTKNEICSERKELLTWNEKHFSSFSKGFLFLSVARNCVRIEIGPSKSKQQQFGFNFNISKAVQRREGKTWETLSSVIFQ